MSGGILISVSAVLTLVWVPILLRFVRAWQARHNPISLAICGIILLSIYSNILTIAVYLYESEPAWAAYATHSFNALICLNFYLAFLWSNKKFPDSRT